MLEKNGYIVYRKDVCVIDDIIEMRGQKYYSLSPLSDKSLSLKVPVDNNYLRSVISKSDAAKLINNIVNIPTLDLNEKMLEGEYHKLLATCSLENLITIIKTTYLRNLKRKKAGKKIGEKDDYYFEVAEKLLYTELAIGLNKTFEETKQYVIDKLSEKNS